VVIELLRTHVVYVVVELPKKRNPLRRPDARIALNPYYANVRAREIAKQSLSKEAKEKELAKRRQLLRSRNKEFKSRRQAFIAAASKEGEIKF
jgi:hypothetical protein